MKIGMCTIAFREVDILEVIKIAGDTGFSGIELWGREGHSGVAGRRIPSIKKACEKRGLEINSFGSYLNLSSKNFHAEMEETLDICRLLNPGILRVWAGDKSSKDTSEEEYAGILANGKILAECLKETGIIAAPEFHSGTFCDNSAGILRLAGDISRENFRAYWQPLWQDNFNQSLEDVLPILVNIHAQNFKVDVETKKRSAASLEKGDVDYRLVVEKLKAGGYTGYIEIEFIGGTGVREKTSLLKKDFDFLKQVLSGCL